MDAVPNAPAFSAFANMCEGVYTLGDVLPAPILPLHAPAAASGGFLFHLWTVDVLEHAMPVVAGADAAAAAVEAESLCADRAARAVADHEASSADAAPPAPCLVFLTGHTPEGAKVGISTRFMPTCVVELPRADGDTSRWFQSEVLPALAWALRIKPHHIGVQFKLAPRWLGYVPDALDPCKRARFPMVTLSFPNTRLMQRGAALLRQDHSKGLTLKRGAPLAPLSVYEDGIDVVTKFHDHFRLAPASWHWVADPSGRPLQPRAMRQMLVATEYEVPHAGWLTPVSVAADGFDPECVPPLLIGVLDAEMNAVVADRFPQAFRHDNAVVAVSLVFAYAGAVPAALAARGVPEYAVFERRLFLLSAVCEPIAGVVVELFTDECDMIARVRDALFVDKHVDVLAGHNLIGFDMEYLASRVRTHGSDAAKRFMRFGVLFTEALSLEARDLSSSAFGSNRLAKMDGAGFVYVDTMLLAKQNCKLAENTLAAAAASVGLPLGKFDMPYRLIPVVAASADAAAWRKLGAYCVQDSELVAQLMGKWDTVKDLVAQCRIINIMPAMNVQCGQQKRVRNYLIRDAREEGMVMNGVNVRGERGDDSAAEGVSAVGGFVLDAQPGLHNKPVCVLDFASLYPSMQRMKNLCWTTVFRLPLTAAAIAAYGARGLVIERHDTATGVFHFVVNVPGVFPKALNALAAKRSQYKRNMAAAAYGSNSYQIANLQQLATKIVMNSGYGTANCHTGIMPCREVGTTTCHWGRILNQDAEAFTRSVFGALTLYGDTDSIMVHFPEPAEVAAGTPLARVMYAGARGHEAEAALNAYLEKKYATPYAKVEFEKLYFPYLLALAKTYWGWKLLPDVFAKLDDALDLLGRPGVPGGQLESKGGRNVRRDTARFLKAMCDGMLKALFIRHSPDEFWAIVHATVERVCTPGAMPVEDFILTAELKSGYADKAVISSQAAVAFAREYAVRGAGFQDGVRVPFVYVEESDAQRLVAPAWLKADAARRAEAGGTSVHGAVYRDIEEEEAEEEEAAAAAAPGSAARRRFEPAGVRGTVDPKKAKRARHPEEVQADPDRNHIDVEHYVEAICSVLKQMMPLEAAAAEELRRYGAAAKIRNARARGVAASAGLFAFMSDGGELQMPRLSHRAPLRSGSGQQLAITHLTSGELVAAAPAAKRASSRKPPPARFMAGSLVLQGK